MSGTFLHVHTGSMVIWQRIRFISRLVRVALNIHKDGFYPRCRRGCSFFIWRKGEKKARTTKRLLHSGGALRKNDQLLTIELKRSWPEQQQASTMPGLPSKTFNDRSTIPLSKWGANKNSNSSSNNNNRARETVGRPHADELISACGRYVLSSDEACCDWSNHNNSMLERPNNKKNELTTHLEG